MNYSRAGVLVKDGLVRVRSGVSNSQETIRLILAQAHGELSDADWHLFLGDYACEPSEEAGERDILAYQYKEFVERRRQERR